jgi:hypothetical protein
VEELAAAAAAAGADADEASSSSQRKVFLAEPVAFYKLESGEVATTCTAGQWWHELLLFYSSDHLQQT